MFNSKLPSEVLKNDFKEYSVLKNGEEFPFSPDTIIKDLVNTGIPICDSLDCLYLLKPHLTAKMNTNKIAKLVNQILEHMGYGPQYYIKGEYIEPTYIVFETSEEILSYKLIKKIVRTELFSFKITSKSFRAIVDETFRITKSLRTKSIQYKILKNLVSNACLNVIGVNPFDKNCRSDDYLSLISIRSHIKKTWVALPTDERAQIIENILNHIFRIVLLSYNYLPGYIFPATLYQIRVFVNDSLQKKQHSLDDNILFVLGKSAKKIEDIRKSIRLGHTKKLKESLRLKNWESELDVLNNLTDELMNKGSINWIIITDYFGNELFSLFDEGNVPRNKNLYSMAISGVQNLMGEITNNSITQIDQLGENNKTTILIERRKHFSVIMLVQQPVRLALKKIMEDIADYTEQHLNNEIINFKGNVSIFYKILEKHVRELVDGFM